MEVSRFLRRKLRDMSAFEIVGGNALKGTVIPQGAKNEALQIISAVLLTAEPVIIRNIPEIIDVLKLIDLLQDIGVKVEKLAKGEFKFIADDVNLEYLKTEDYKKKAAALRGSIMLVGLDKDTFRNQVEIRLVAVV